MRIGDLAQQTGVNRRLLRYYEEQGLLTPARSVNGYREYADADVARVRSIRALLAAGLPTVVIGRILHCVSEEDGRVVSSGCPAVVTDLARERARITDTISRLRAAQRSLDAIAGTSRDTVAAPDAASTPPAEPWSR